MSIEAPPTAAGPGPPEAEPPAPTHLDDHLTGGTVELTPPGSGRAAFLRLSLIVGLGVLAAIVLGAVPVLVVVLALVVMIMLHELGHFATAKWSGMKVTEYFLGFGPRLWSVRRGETEYGVKAIPAGGYVRIVGMTTLEEVSPTDEPRSYRQATFPRRFAVGVAGSTMHFIMAFALLFALYAFVGTPVASPPTIAGLGTFAGAKTPAQLAGLAAGDVVVSVDGRHFDNLDNFAAFVAKRPGQPLRFVVRRDGQDVTAVVTPVDPRGLTETVGGETITYPKNGPDKGVIGVDLSGSKNVTLGPIDAVGHSVTAIGSLVSETASGLAQVFSLHGLGSFAHQVTHATDQSTSSGSSSGAASTSSQGQGQILSLLGAIEIGAQAFSQDVGELLVLLAAINIFVGIVNLFPMLPLDGGHVAIAVYERVRSRRNNRYHADVAKLMPVAYVFLAFIIVIGLGALYLNVVHPAQLPGG